MNELYIANTPIVNTFSPNNKHTQLMANSRIPYLCKKEAYKWSESHGLLPSRVNTLKALIYCSDENNISHASHKGIAATIKMRTSREVSIRTVVNHLKWLEANGLIKVDRSPIWKRTNTTQILMPKSDNITQISPVLENQNELPRQCATFAPVYSYNLIKYNNHNIHNTLDIQGQTAPNGNVDYMNKKPVPSGFENDGEAQDLSIKLAAHGVFLGVVWFYLRQHGVTRGCMEWTDVANDPSIRNKGAYWRKKMASLGKYAPSESVERHRAGWSPPSNLDIPPDWYPPQASNMPIKATTEPVEAFTPARVPIPTGSKHIREILAANTAKLKASGRSQRGITHDTN